MSRAVRLETGWLPIHLYFCPDKTAWRRLMKTIGAGSVAYPTAAGNCAHFECEADGRMMTVVTVREGAEQTNALWEISALFGHEAVHVLQRIMEFIGEKNAGSEVEAYIVQDLTLRLTRAFIDTRLTPKKRKRKRKS